MSVEQKPQATEQKRQAKHDEPKQDVQAEQELTSEDLEQVVGGVGDLASPEPPPIEPDESFRQAWPKKYSG
jgi:hypothetical protein